MNSKSTKVIVPCRVSYLHCFKPYSFSKDAPGKYMVTALISKNDRSTVKKVNSAISAAIEKGKTDNWNGKIPNNLKTPLNDGDEKEDETGIYKDNFYITAKSKSAPQVVDQFVKPIYSDKEIYSGCYCNVSINFMPYSAGPNKGVTAMLGNIQLIKKGESLGGRARAEDEFNVIDDEEDTEENFSDGEGNTEDGEFA